MPLVVPPVQPGGVKSGDGNDDIASSEVVSQAAQVGLMERAKIV